MTTSGLFDVPNPPLVRDAHLDWCAANTVDPKSALGEEAAAYLLRAFNAGCNSAEELIATLDRHINEREGFVQIGGPALPSSTEQLTD
jgi:hypothetical protein